jgi:hypothetical protein
MDEEVRTATFDFRVLREGLHFPTGLLGIALADWEVPDPRRTTAGSPGRPYHRGRVLPVPGGPLAHLDASRVASGAAGRSLIGPPSALQHLVRIPFLGVEAHE